MTAYIKKTLDAIYGNSAQKSFFVSEAEKGRLAHAYILEGAPGSGRYTMALAVCALLEGSDRGAMMIDSGQATDILVIGLEAGKKSIGVDAIRQIRSGAYIKPNDFEFKAYIVKNSDRMTPQAQNAFLKLLEEPPANVYFFLLCENSSSLLPTVRSRASVIRMQTFSGAELAEYITSRDPAAKRMQSDDPERFESLIRSSGNTVGGVLAGLASEGGDGEDTDKITLDLLSMLAGRDRIKFYLTVNSLPQNREELSAQLFSLIKALRDIALIKYDRNSEELCFGYAEKLREFSRKFTVGRINGYYEALTFAQSDLSANCNVQSVKTALCGRLWKTV